jgi:hypothetical protein
MLQNINKSASESLKKNDVGKGVAIVGNQKPAESCCMESLFSES